MVEINLLPQELRPKTYVLILSKTFYKISYVFLAILFVTASLFLVTFIFYSRKNSTLRNEKEKIIAQIKALEATEQRFILIKDRLEKIEKITTATSKPQAYISSLESVYLLLPENASLQNSTFGDDGIRISVSSPLLAEISTLLSSLVNSKEFSRIEFQSFGFSSEEGFSISLVLSK